MKKEKTLAEIIRELHHISGFRISIYDTERQELYAYPNQLTSFCGLVQQNTAALALCRQYDDKGFQKAQETGEAYLYRCHFGLYEAVAPLYHFGTLTGYLMMGQTLDSMKKSRSDVYDKACGYLSDYDLLKTAVAKIPYRKKSQILSCISIMEICASYITLNNHLKATNKDLPTMANDYILQNFSMDITLESLCRQLYCSRATLTASFRQAFGKSVNQYLTEVRLTHSQELLRNTALTVYEIARKCGFSDQNYFTKVFRKHLGMTPSEYRLR